MPRANVRTKIAEQKGFLERSVADYLDGHTAEAMRLALSIRVLVHETARQTPLLKMFRTNYLDLEILDNIHAPPPRGRILLRLGLGFNMSNGVKPLTDLTGNKPTTIGKWWRRTCLVFAPTPESESVEFTRRDLLLTLANSEGGAHVDAVLPPQYEKYVIDSPVKLMNNGIETDSVHLAQFAAVQAAAQMIDCINRLLA